VPIIKCVSTILLAILRIALVFVCLGGLVGIVQSPHVRVITHQEILETVTFKVIAILALNHHLAIVIPDFMGFPVFLVSVLTIVLAMESVSPLFIHLNAVVTKCGMGLTVLSHYHQQQPVLQKKPFPKNLGPQQSFQLLLLGVFLLQLLLVWPFFFEVKKRREKKDDMGAFETYAMQNGGSFAFSGELSRTSSGKNLFVSTSPSIPPQELYSRPIHSSVDNLLTESE